MPRAEGDMERQSETSRAREGSFISRAKKPAESLPLSICPWAGLGLLRTRSRTRLLARDSSKRLTLREASAWRGRGQATPRDVSQGPRGNLVLGGPQDTHCSCFYSL